jgi:formate hydrogenlyase subunit 3/multisubunit Na+/H+ antiporter MnhD subunit
MVFYAAAVSWDPVHSFRGYVGPFTNPSVIVGVLLAVALVLVIRRLTAAARLFSILAIVVSIILGLLAWAFGWQGPSAPAVVVFAAFGACGLSRSNRISRGITLAAASACAAFAAVCLEDMALQSTFGPSAWWREETLLAAFGVVAAALLAWPWRRRVRASKRGSGLHRPPL